jgi:hypothetical protein
MWPRLTAASLVAFHAFCVAACATTNPPASSNAGAPAPNGPAMIAGAESDKKAIAAVLDDWHDAAAHAAEDRYFGHFAENGVFLGTDATERWDVPAFRAYAHPHFARGKAWSFRAVRRTIEIAPGATVAWFDEDLDTPNLGPARGSGVLVRRASAAGEPWRIAQYNLSVPIPNERFDEVKRIIAGPGAGADKQPDKTSPRRRTGRAAASGGGR